VSASALFQAGRLSETVDALAAQLRSNPLDAHSRTFLFELLCFTGEYDRADIHLEALAGASAEAGLGAWLYRAALHAERTRQGMFRAGAVPPPPAPQPPVAAAVNGRAVAALADADPRIGARLEVFAAGEYMLIPFDRLASIRIEPPGRLRDLIWAPAVLQPAPAYQGLELGEVLLPVLAPLSWQHPDDQVRLGHVTDWEEDALGNAHPVGQKLLLLDEDEEIPFLELRTIEISPAQAG